MPVNITKGQSAQFIVEFVDSAGNLTIPSGGTVEITYILGITTALEIVPLTANQSFWNGTWASSVADYGPAVWRVYSADSTSVVASSGDLRILDTTA